jgi:hypothetical protein
MSEKLSIIEEWKIDSQITLETITDYSLSIPNLHSKYLDKLKRSKSTLRQCEIEFDKYKFELRRYFRCEMNNKEDLERMERKPWPSQIAYNQLEDYLNGDDEYCTLKNKIGRLREEKESLEEIVLHINRLSYNLSNIIKWESVKLGN